MEIHILSEETINQIAAGEVVERPCNAAKELVENAIDAGADAITVEIKGGGIELLRVTDNGCGIESSQIHKAFRRHATSKIQDEKDLHRLHSLGFRGEALSSIAAVSQVEMITKTRGSLTGIRVSNQVHSLQTPEDPDSIPLTVQEIGAPDGTSVILRNLFYNLPVRRKFLKTPQTEAGYITDFMEKLAFSHPEISFHYIVNGQEKLHTTGSGKVREIIYRIYGKETSSCVIPIKAEVGDYTLEGFIGRPEISRSSRGSELFFVNGRTLRSDILSKALEEGFGTDLMQHRFPFAVLYLQMPADEIDVNVHPAKLEVRFTEGRKIYDFICSAVHECLHGQELIPRVTMLTAAEEQREHHREEQQRLNELQKADRLEPFERDENSRSYQPDNSVRAEGSIQKESPAVGVNSELLQQKDDTAEEPFVFEDRRAEGFRLQEAAGSSEHHQITVGNEAIRSLSSMSSDSGIEYEQLSFFREETIAEPRTDYVLSEDHLAQLKLIGQLFETYWIIEYRDEMLMIDQHAAHEKVNYERIMNRLNGRTPGQICTQQLFPPAVIHLSGKEETAYRNYEDTFRQMGYEIEEFGAGAYAIRGVPTELFGSSAERLLLDTLEEILSEKMSGTPAVILAKIASMSCKAAVKGDMKLSFSEAENLIRELMTLDNPYHCPHGRPTVIRLSKTEIERKFKRIV